MTGFVGLLLIFETIPAVQWIPQSLRLNPLYEVSIGSAKDRMTHKVLGPIPVSNRYRKLDHKMVQFNIFIKWPIEVVHIGPKVQSPVGGEFDVGQLRLELGKVLDQLQFVEFGHRAPDLKQRNASSFLHDDILDAHSIGTVG